jgi:hypothetical protein
MEFFFLTLEMGSVTRIYIQSFIKIGSAIEKSIRGFTNTHSAWSSLETNFTYKNKESGLKKNQIGRV